MSDRDTFGPRLRSERERRGISIETIVAVTKVGADLWLGLERNDFSKWPSGIFARAFVRDYAKAVGLDADEVVDEFCRLFPHGDRRAARIIRAQAQLIGHSTGTIDDSSLAPRGGDRRAAARDRTSHAQRWRIRLAPRSIAAAIDVGCTTALALLGPAIAGAGFWASAGVAAIVYYSLSTILSGATLGTHVVDFLRQRMPELFAVRDRRAHA
jgi:helix-turn-helix protein